LERDAEEGTAGTAAEEMMTFSAPAKINLSLRILGRREDGFHEIESLMVPISLADTLEITRQDGAGFQFTCDDASLPVDDTNLVARAAKLFCATVGVEPRVRIHLQKRIPHGAGLGGGSSDAAATLLALNTLFASELPLPALSELAAQIGSDVPFFLHRSAATVGGRGEVVTPCTFPHELALLLLKPPFGVPTPWAYQRWRDSQEIPTVRYAPQEFAWGSLVNDLERPVFEKYLFLAQLKKWLLGQPEAVGALMSGSGATVFAVLPAEENADALADRARAEFGADLWTAACKTVSPASRR
jgi:4-diphosphocytidyl-2-C-methyl-D-erythritol kinase